ncbi:hypothetical protein CkaCkLH20_06629 [Colletotrichum karsti]|uniref:Uncharacterized protein n=1 Tax=Colletotrichum karsti TaxID=1095194 RepID=A0A9P6I2D1_9PEZI|nr:uncharacterized protein CkaCkLH20_06629 [Colletotrichum karsti]KAF9875697.1 hypothetical protein CkaCkLH20_06629 [Colletotrichum karsti]
MHENVDNMRTRVMSFRIEENKAIEGIARGATLLPTLQSASPEVMSEYGSLIIGLRENDSQSVNTIRVSRPVLEKASVKFSCMMQFAAPQKDGRRYMVLDLLDPHAGRCMFAALHRVNCGEPEAKTILGVAQYTVTFDFKKALAPLLSGWCEQQLKRLAPGPWRDDHTLFVVDGRPTLTGHARLDIESSAIYKGNIRLLSQMFTINIGNAASSIPDTLETHKSFSTNSFYCRVCVKCGQDMPSEPDMCTAQSRAKFCMRIFESIKIIPLSELVSIFMADQIVKAYSELSERVEHECSGGDACPLRLHFAALPEKLDTIAKTSEKQLQVELLKRYSEYEGRVIVF